jgi:hypothetical protein
LLNAFSPRKKVAVGRMRVFSSSRAECPLIRLAATLSPTGAMAEEAGNRKLRVTSLEGRSTSLLSRA